MGIFSLSFFVIGLRLSSSLVFASVGGVISERSGVVNIGLEGMMLMGAFLAVVGSHFSGSPFVGVVMAALGGGALAMIHAILCVRYKANQAVSSVGIILLATGLTSFGVRAIFGQVGNSPQVPAINQSNALASVPLIGGVLTQFSPLVYLAIVIVVAAHIVLYRTPIGLRLRSVGENPRAADTLGIKVERIRISAVVLSGILAGIGGSYISLGQMNLFQERMSAGRGFIALAAMIMGKWTPIGAALSCLLFGFAEALQLRLQIVPNNPFPADLMLTLPYVVTLIVLAGVVGRAHPPASNGKPYDRYQR